MVKMMMRCRIKRYIKERKQDENRRGNEEHKNIKMEEEWRKENEGKR